ncbi:hypothetical protein B0T26DRAFT_872134 [Lasiosphaeria miniovina]|uniref:C2H2-type domain-containing protein n=1 Tax=Lasiosphaeria miniovina TaxID=1954250 RepID=A0AA40DVC9_9PEZI|nr:uncharacterized protein B0T26DRAFT_872134 [Lasiosphaeria miniovina]KAK0717739.1 hypothetical protein B0T26DRAFT_872134 [Lasiosphaeria miniovina]
MSRRQQIPGWGQGGPGAAGLPDHSETGPPGWDDPAAPPYGPANEEFAYAPDPNNVNSYYQPPATFVHDAYHQHDHWQGTYNTTYAEQWPPHFDQNELGTATGHQYSAPHDDVNHGVESDNYSVGYDPRIPEAELDGLENDINHISLSPPHDMGPTAGYEYDYDAAGPSGEGSSGYEQPDQAAQQADRSHRHHRAPGSSTSGLTCELCGDTFPTNKNRQRHDLSKKHTDNLAAASQTSDVVRYYRCACTYTQARKDLYSRHLKKCKYPSPAPFGYQVMYRCSCLQEDDNKDAHISHIDLCGRKRWGKRGFGGAARPT